MAKPELDKITKQYAIDLHELHGKYGYPARQKTSPYFAAYNHEKEKLQLRYYLEFDHKLDLANSGPMFLSDPRAKQIVIDSWKFLESKGRVKIYAICVMSNHVHIIISSPDESLVDLNALMERHKTFTGYKINQFQGKTGRSVWARRPFDRTIREGKLGIALAYVLNNPVKARLCRSYLEWPGNYWAEELESQFHFLASGAARHPLV